MSDGGLGVKGWVEWVVRTNGRCDGDLQVGDEGGMEGFDVGDSRSQGAK